MNKQVELIRAEIERQYAKTLSWSCSIADGVRIRQLCNELLAFIDSMQEEPATEYSFNIPSEVFHQLTAEQQKLWKKEIEQAYNAGAKWQKQQLMK